MSATAHPSMVFLVPHETLGRVDDVMPERLTAAQNDWIAHNREILRKRKQPAHPPAGVKSSSAADCPVMAELDSIGLLLKWPATAILRQVNPKGWEIKPSANFNFYNYNPMTSIPEQGEAEALLVDTGFTVVAPPGWSVLFKNIPNNIGGAPRGITFAEGVVRADQATVPLRVHAFLKTNAKEIRVKRGEPMAMLLAFRREAQAWAVMDETVFRDEAAKLAAANKTALEAPGAYRKLYVEGTSNPTPLYPTLLDAFAKREGER